MARARIVIEFNDEGKWYVYLVEKAEPYPDWRAIVDSGGPDDNWDDAVNQAVATAQLSWTK